MSEKNEIWILSIDGGGIRSLIPAIILSYIESKINRPVSQCFDLIAGTSSGAVIAAGLSINKSGKQTLETKEFQNFFFQDGPGIFRRSSSSIFTNLRRLWGPVHDIGYLRKVIEKQLGNTLLSDLQNNILITSYDMRQGRPVLFQSWLARSGQQDVTAKKPEGLREFCPISQSPITDVKLVDAVLASSAVPTFFEPVRLSRGNDEFALIDGFVYALNPVIPAYFAARKLYGSQKPIRILSIGTGKYEKTYKWKQIRRWGGVRWVRPMLEVFPDSVSDASEVYMQWISEVLDVELIRLQAVFDKEKFSDSPSSELDDASKKNLESLSSAAQRMIVENRTALAKVIESLKANEEKIS